MGLGSLEDALEMEINLSIYGITTFLNINFTFVLCVVCVRACVCELESERYRERGV